MQQSAQKYSQVFRSALAQLLCKIGLHVWDSTDAGKVCLVCHVRAALAEKLSAPTVVTQKKYSLDAAKELQTFRERAQDGDEPQKRRAAHA